MRFSGTDFRLFRHTINETEMKHKLGENTLITVSQAAKYNLVLKLSGKL